MTASLLALSTLLAPVASAETSYGEDRRWFLNFLAGGATAFDNDLDSGPEAAFGIGKPFADHFAWELSLSYLDLEANSGGAYQRTALSAGVMMFPRAAFIAERKKLQPYLGVYATVHDIDFANQESQNFGADIALGLLYSLGRVDLRAELRHQVDEFEVSVPGFNDQSFRTTAGLIGVRVPLGPAPKSLAADEDYDGVPDHMDKCLNTPIGVTVDLQGCPVDSDGDGVPDFSDRCPNTAAGVKVNADGCALDSDQDGVPNDYDQCPASPAGAVVNSQGCALDSDGDNVPNGIDACPNTLAGARVNSQGCVINQVVELRGVHFEFDKARLMLDSRAVLKKVVESLQNEPTVKVVVEGHTDDLGRDAYNQSLSEQRAQAVVDFMVSQGVARHRVTARGYGESRPVADNSTEQGRELNRRVELRISAQ